jgi:hypothetical protein
MSVFSISSDVWSLQSAVAVICLHLSNAHNAQMIEAAEQLEIQDQMTQQQHQRRGGGGNGTWSEAAAVAAAAESRHRVGRWGEELAFHMLTAALAEGCLGRLLPGASGHPAVISGDRRLSIVWVNQDKESGLPYDIVLAALPQPAEPGGRKGTGGAGEVVAYVEVSSSLGFICMYTEGVRIHIRISLFSVSRLCP